MSARDEAAAVPDLAQLVRGLAWRAAPVAEVDVDLRDDLLLVTCFEGMPQVELEFGANLSAGFLRVGDDYLLTTLCLAGLSSWAALDPGDDVRAARALLGPTISAAVRPGADDVRSVPLLGEEADALIATWLAAVNADRPAPPLGCAPADIELLARPVLASHAWQDEAWQDEAWPGCVQVLDDEMFLALHDRPRRPDESAPRLSLVPMTGARTWQIFVALSGRPVYGRTILCRLFAGLRQTAVPLRLISTDPGEGFWLGGQGWPLADIAQRVTAIRLEVRSGPSARPGPRPG